MADIKKLPKSEIEVRLSASWEEWSTYIDGAVKSIAESIKIEGFRSGKAPRHLVEKRVGIETILAESADRAIRKIWEKTLTEEKIEAIGHPKAEITHIGENETLEFTITTAVMPTITLKEGWQKSVKKINEAEKKKSPTEVRDEEVQKELEKIAESRAKFVAVDRVAKKGDGARVDFLVKMNGQVIPGGEAKDHAITLGSGTFIPGFEEQLEGMKSGEEKTFTLSFPEQYHEKSLAGKEAEFVVTMRVVQERQKPKIDDEFAVSLGGFKDLEALKKSVREGMQKERAQKREDERQAILAETVLQNIETELPDILIEEENIVMLREFEAQLAGMGANMEEYLKHIGKTVDDMKQEMRPQAEKRLTLTLGLLDMAKSEGVDASAEEVEEEMNKTLRYYKSPEEAEKKLDMKRLYSYAKEAVVRRKVMEYIENL